MLNRKFEQFESSQRDCCSKQCTRLHRALQLLMKNPQQSFDLIASIAEPVNRRELCQCAQRTMESVAGLRGMLLSTAQKIQALQCENYKLYEVLANYPGGPRREAARVLEPQKQQQVAGKNDLELIKNLTQYGKENQEPDDQTCRIY